MKLTVVCLFLCLVAAVPGFALEEEMSPETDSLQQSPDQADDPDKNDIDSQQEFLQTAGVMGNSEHEAFQDLYEEKRWSSGGYRCPLSDRGRRIHEMTSATPYDCRDSRGGNTCKGGQCVAYVTCRCKSRSTGGNPPNTRCWRPGAKVVNRDGRCNRNIASGTAIATFTRGSYYGHAAVFVGCDNEYTIKTWDQWCCRSIGYSRFTRRHRYYDKYYVIENGGCSDRRSWRCRSEAAGRNCCR